MVLGCCRWDYLDPKYESDNKSDPGTDRGRLAFRNSVGNAEIPIREVHVHHVQVIPCDSLPRSYSDTDAHTDADYTDTDYTDAHADADYTDANTNTDTLPDHRRRGIQYLLFLNLVVGDFALGDRDPALFCLLGGGAHLRRHRDNRTDHLDSRLLFAMCLEALELLHAA